MRALEFLSAGARVVSLLGVIVKAVQAVEALVAGRPGREKQDAAVRAVHALLGVAETAADRNLLHDADVEAATRAAIDAVVALQNALARARAAAAPMEGRP